jgi:hypothetical protein
MCQSLLVLKRECSAQVVHSWEVATDRGTGFDPREVVFRGSYPYLEIPPGLLVPETSYMVKLSSLQPGAAKPHDSCLPWRAR